MAVTRYFMIPLLCAASLAVSFALLPLKPPSHSMTEMLPQSSKGAG
jgi:hypothetical protein